jgi:hypothetical protein
MDLIETVADRCIRRGLGFAGLAIGLVMVSLSFDVRLSLRMGADLSACVAVVMLVAAWRAHHRDMRRSETWAEVRALRPDLIRQLPRQEAQHRLAQTLRRRLLWHAERVGLIALVLWVLTLAVSFARQA